MPKYGNITNPSKDILKEIKTIGNLGFDYVEIGIEGPEGMPEILIKKKKHIIRLLKKYNMFAIGHCAYYVNLGSVYESVRKGWLEESKKSIRAAYELGIKKIVFHSHSKGMFISSKKSKKTILKNYILSLKELVRYGKKFNNPIQWLGINRDKYNRAALVRGYSFNKDGKTYAVAMTPPLSRESIGIRLFAEE